MTLTIAKAQLATQLFNLGAIKFGAFKLKLHETHPDAELSPIYLNLRTKSHPKNPGPLTDETMATIGSLFEDMVHGDDISEYQRFADIPEAGTPFGNQIEFIDPTPQRRLRLEKLVMADGSRRISDHIHGTLTPGQTCLLVDDLITGADTKLEAIATLEQHGLIVKDILVVVDRGQGGRQQLEKRGYKIHAIFTLSELLNHYSEEGQLTNQQAQVIADYLERNQVT